MHSASVSDAVCYASNSDQIAQMPRMTRRVTTRHSVYHFRFASGLAISRAQSMKSCATGLSARFFRVTITFCTWAMGSSTGKTLISERMVGNVNTEAGKIVTKRPDDGRRTMPRLP